jgi:virulence-associated protein VagC
MQRARLFSNGKSQAVRLPESSGFRVQLVPSKQTPLSIAPPLR